MKRIVFVIGGAKSGKSRFAQKLAESWNGHKVFMATAQAWDQEMRRRIERHQNDRGPEWDTVEEPLALAKVLKKQDGPDAIMLVDCLTLWLSNLVITPDATEETITPRFDELTKTLKALTGRVILVANEVGLGIVPDNALARAYRDYAGNLNQAVARVADQVVLVTAGIPQAIKGPPITFGEA